MKKIIIFCQAAGDIKYTLSLYEQFHHEATIDIYLLPGHPAFQFIEDIDLSANIHWINEPPPLFSFKKLWRVWYLKKYVSKLWNDQFSKCKNADVYFFSEVIDWITLSMVARLSKRNRVIHVEHYPYLVNKARNISIKERLYLCFFCIGAGASFSYCRLGSSGYHRRQRVLNMNKYFIERQSAWMINDIVEKYGYSIANAKKALLFIDSPAVEDFTRNYNQVMRKFLSLCEGYNVKLLVKPHPRVPIHSLYHGFKIEEVPAYIPGEFLPIKEFGCVAGISSTLLGYAASQRKSFSIINCFEWKQEGDRAYGENIIRHHSQDKIHLVHSLEDCKQWLEGIS